MSTKKESVWSKKESKIGLGKEADERRVSVMMKREEEKRRERRRTREIYGVRATAVEVGAVEMREEGIVCITFRRKVSQSSGSHSLFPQEKEWSGCRRVVVIVVLKGHLIEQQCQRLLLIPVSILELFAGQKARQWHHGILHVHNTALLLIDVGSIHDNTLQVVEAQGSIVN